jgi:hypothetical protein
MEVRKVKKQLNLRFLLKTLKLKAMEVEYTPTPRFIVNHK